MLTRAAFAAGLLAVMVVSPRALQQGPPPPRPTFQGRVDLMQLDVSVLDSSGRPIKGLTAADFTVFEEGKPRRVEALLEIDVPPGDKTASTVAWRDQVQQDVFSSQTVAVAKRVVVIVIDDNSLQRSQQNDARIIQKTREVARAAVADLGDADLAALVYASDNFSAQSLTSDRYRLLRSIESARLFPGSEGELSAVDNSGAQSGECACNLCSVNVLEDVSKALAAIPNMRKTVLYVGAGITPPPPVAPPGMPDCYQHYVSALQRTYRDAALANVNVHAFDPTGLRAIPGGAGRMREVGGDYRTTVGIEARTEFLRMIAENTGGVAIVNNNDPDLRVPQVLDRSRSYYLIGFQPTNLTPDGKMRRLRVEVNRKGATVEARKGYVVPLPEVASPRPAAANAAKVLPATAFPLEASVGAFAERNGKAGAALTLGITAPNLTLAAGPVRVLARIVDPFGGARGTFTRTLQFPKQNGEMLRRYDLLAKLPVPPGRYEIRLSVETADGQTSGVNAPIDVPDFSTETLSASSLVLSATPSPDVIPDDAVSELIPVLPTTRRAFDGADDVTAYVRVYSKERRQSPTVEIEVINADGQIVVADDRTLSMDAFGSIYAANCMFDVPVRRLEPGEYRLSMQIDAGKDSVQRSVRFVVR